VDVTSVGVEELKKMVGQPSAVLRAVVLDDD
jgi:hypothetical protein